jgi:DNA-binding beta-propeller fold protein YncE
LAASSNSLKITTIAGQPYHLGYADGIGKQALFNRPIGINLSEDGYLYVADAYNNKVRKILLYQRSNGLQIQLQPAISSYQMACRTQSCVLTSVKYGRLK